VGEADGAEGEELAVVPPLVVDPPEPQPPSASAAASASGRRNRGAAFIPSLSVRRAVYLRDAIRFWTGGPTSPAD
jgi:hypothetical protein